MSRLTSIPATHAYYHHHTHKNDHSLAELIDSGIGLHGEQECGVSILGGHVMYRPFIENVTFLEQDGVMTVDGLVIDDIDVGMTGTPDVREFMCHHRGRDRSATLISWRAIRHANKVQGYK